MTDRVGTESDKLPASMKGEGQKSEGFNKGEDLLEVKTDRALHGGTHIVPEPYSAAVPVEKIDTPLPGVQTQGGTSRLAYGVEAPPTDLGAAKTDTAPFGTGALGK
ncbi:hypothetical protein WJX75_008045 [Coccomyxa subellipsoidea]|uniref:Seed maturation protein n=1 Tax=Coccomyxa subellipsoidea TaxID=248742 RepID=A0ABR2Z0R0_9CHLO